MFLGLAGCAQRPQEDDAADAFAVTLESAHESMNTALGELSQYEVSELAYHDYAVRAASAAAPGRGTPPVPPRPRTAADDARDALNPAFTALSLYAARLSDLTDDASPAAIGVRPDALAAAAGRAARALGAQAGKPLAEGVVAQGQAAIQTLASFGAGGPGPRDVAGLVQAMGPAVGSLDAFVTAVVGADDGAGLRSVLAQANRRAGANLDHDVAMILADRQETRAGRIGRIEDVLRARDSAPGDALLDALLRASHAIVVAHAALVAPDSAAAAAAVQRLANRVDELGRRYERFRPD